MTSRSLSSWPRVYLAYARTSGRMVSVLGATTMAGWVLDIDAFKSVLPGLVPMKPAGAGAIVLLGLAITRAADRERLDSLTRLIAIVIAALGVVALGEFATGAHLRVDVALFPEARDVPFPMLMGPFAAVILLLCACALLMLDVRTEAGLGLSQWLAVLAGLLATSTMLGYIFGVEYLLGARTVPAMAVHMATALGLAASAILFLRPDQGFMRVLVSDTAGGRLARPLLVATPLAVALFGWIALLGARLGAYDSRFSMALMAVLSIVLSTAFIAWQARVLHRVDLQRLRALAALEHHNRTLEETVRQRTEELQRALDAVERPGGAQGDGPAPPRPPPDAALP